MSFATLGEMASRRKHPYTENIGMVSDGNAPMVPPPEYKVDRDDTLNPSPWDIREWSWKKWAALIGGIVIVVVVVVIAVVEVEKKNKYPDYSALTYTLADTCKYLLLSTSQTYSNHITQTPEHPSSTTSTTSPATTPPPASSTTSPPLKPNPST